ncbi:MAG: reductive dehalogenase [Deltaproteobacteria bacterium]
MTFFVNFLIVLCLAALAFQAFVGVAFFLSSIYEKERRAAVVGFFQCAVMVGVLVLFVIWVMTGFFHTVLGRGLLILFFAASGAAVFYLTRRTEKNQRALQGSSGLIVGYVKRFDERMHVFARNRSLRPESPEYSAFYREHPELEDYDRQRRKRGGPVGKVGSIDQPKGGVPAAMALASQKMCEYLSIPEIYRPQPHIAFREKVAKQKTELSPQEAAERVKGYARHLGAALVGVTEINPLWLYAQRGEIFHENWDDWGRDITLDTQYAVVMAEEMSLEMIGAAPHTPTVVESMQVYAKGAYIATQVAAFIANLGYQATANHLRHYDAILPALAVDAGLGELGRLGYLISRELGPRIRLSAVLTDLPLTTDRPVDIGVMDFCRACKKCAACCPSQSIPREDDPSEHNGLLRWKLKAETCFDYWGKIGTDCNVCMKVCPWSHARTFPHQLIVWLVSRNKHARKIFLAMDDVFYGKKPKPKPAPRWADTH